jgi:dipeptidyl aminopeptidase/acylaminoacyl peptidase
MKAKLTLFIILILVSFASAQDKKHLQMIDVFDLEYADDPQISSDGRHIVYVRNFMDIMKDRKRSNLWIVNVDGSANRALTSGIRNDFSPRWSPDGSRLLYASAMEESGSQIFMRWMDSGQEARLAQLTQPFDGLTWSPDGKWIAFSMLVPKENKPFAQMPAKPEGAEWAADTKVIDRLVYRADGAGYLKPGYWHIFVLPADGGTPRQLTTGDFDHLGRITWTPDGKYILTSANRHDDWEYDPANSEVYEISVQNGLIRPLTSRKGPDQSPAISPNGELIAYTGYDDRYQFYQTTKLYVMKRDGTGSHLITAKLDRDAGNPTWSGDSKNIYFQYDDQGDTKIARADLNGSVHDITGNVGGTSLDRPYASGSFTIAKNGIVAFTYSQANRPADLAISSNDRKDIRKLTALNDDVLAYKQLGSVEEIWYQSSKDNRKIQGWIVKPPGFDLSRKYPLILEIHGGPVANYGPRFGADAQLYASAGYVVLYTNPRGSDSYGEEFGNLIHHNYPGDDYFDLMSGVDAVIAKGYVNPENLFVTGGSGGGVLTAWIVGRTDRFRAAASAKPVINWYSFVLTADMTNFFYKYWFPGFPWDYTEQYMKRSPLALVGNVKTPTMVITGEADYRTPISESEQYYQALKLRKVDTVMVRIPGASHDIANRPSQLIAKVAHILAWFDKYKKK